MTPDSPHAPDRWLNWPKQLTDRFFHKRVEEELGIYEAIIASSDDAIISKTLEGIITSWNQAAERLFGYSAQEAVGQPIMLIIPPELYHEEDGILCNLRQGRRIEHFETTRVRKDGTRIAVSLSISPVRDRSGTIIGAAKIARDITERRREIEERVRLAALVDSADVSIFSKTRDGVITSWNKAAEQMYGYAAQEIIGQPVTLLFPPDRQEEFLAIMEQILRGERVQLFETVRRRKDGTLVPVSVLVSPIYDEQGQVIGASDIAHDITERKRVEEQESLLAELSLGLVATLDPPEMLNRVASLLIPRLADWFAVDLLNAAGSLELCTLVHTDPEKVHWARKQRAQFPPDRNVSSGIAQVARTGQVQWYPDVPDDLLVAHVSSEEELALLRRMGYSSAILAPLLAQGKTIGVMSLVFAESGRTYDRRHLALAEEVGRRVGLALEHAQLHHDVQQSRDQLNIILHGVADGILLYAPENQILYANETAAHMMGFSSVQQLLEAQQSHLLAKYDILDEQGQPIPPTSLTHSRVFAGEREVQMVMRYREKGREEAERWSLVTSRPVMGLHGAVVLVVTIIHDITERMQVEQRKDAFISMASHELKTPVTSLKGFTAILQRRLSKQGDEQGLSYLARMDAQLKKLTSLISELLDISRMQSGQLPFRLEHCDFDALIEEVVDTMQAATTTHQIRMEGQTGARVSADPERLTQVLLNVLTNAIKYSPEAQEIVIRRWFNHEQAVVSVQDFGIGIDQVHHERIFERFYQVGDTVEKTYPGLGIGLYISHEIVTRHHGRMWVESRKGEGSTFFIALPLLAERTSV